MNDLDRLINAIKEFGHRSVVERFRESIKVKGSISMDPFSWVALNRLMYRLRNPNISTFEREWLLKEHLQWARASFTKEKATKQFEQLIRDNLLLPRAKITDRSPIHVAINFNGTSNKIHTKKNRHGELIQEYPFDFRLEVPGVGSSPSLRGDPVGLVEVEMEKYKNLPNNPFSKVFQSIKPRWYHYIARFLFGGLIQTIRIGRGNGTFYASLYAAMKVYELHQQYPDRPIHLNVFGFSRGSVSALFFNLILNKLIDNGSLSPTISVVQLLNDPVPGGDLSQRNSYKNSLKDSAFDSFKSVYPDFVEADHMVEALHRTTQPKLVKKSLITYPVGETRVLFSPIRNIPFDKTTISTIMLTPGGHNEGVYGDYGVGLFALHLRKESSIVAGNISLTHDNHQRRYIARFYKHVSALFLSYSRADTATPFHKWIDKDKAKVLIESYAKFMVEGYAKNILTDDYAILQTDQARGFSSSGSNMPEYFMDTLHEHIFKVQYSTLYDLLKTNPSPEVIQLNPEFKRLPISMKRILLNSKQSSTTIESSLPTQIDSIIPLNYIAAGLFRLKTRFWNLFDRKSEGHERIPLAKRYREEASELVEKTRPLFKKAPIKQLKYLPSTVKILDILSLRDAVKREVANPSNHLTQHEKNFRLKKIELIELLEYYSKKHGADESKIPTPLYLFYQKCPNLLPVYLASPELQKMWHCDVLDQVCPLDEQIDLLEFYQVVENDADAPIVDLTLEGFKKLSQEKAHIENQLHRKIKHYDDIDGVVEQIQSFHRSL